MNARLEVNDGLGQRIVPINKDLLSIGRRTESDLFGQKDNSGAIDVRWYTARRNILRIIANFTDRALALPKLPAGTTIWPQAAKPGGLIRPAEILVRLERLT